MLSPNCEGFWDDSLRRHLQHPHTTFTSYKKCCRSDTTAISLRSIIYYLLKNPESKEKLIKEIDGQRQTGNLSDPVKLEEANDMPYQQAWWLDPVGAGLISLFIIYDWAETTFGDVILLSGLRSAALC